MHTIFVANRGEIARRVVRTARRLGYHTAAACSVVDRGLPYTAEVDALVEWEGPSEARATYLDAERVIAAARRTGADALHPGYGFLSENAVFAEQVLAAGLVWIGPPPEAVRALGDKVRARTLAEQSGVPVLPGSDDPRAPIGFPLLIKAAAGGGGRGMRRVDRAEDLDDALASAKREALAAFGDERVLIERYVARPRHVEVQIAADRHGQVLALGERECSIQRRHQKIIEEAPSPAVDAALRTRLQEAAVRLAQAGGYVGLGTMEFLLDETNEPFFLEVNARLQVEHPVTELVTGLDLVEWQLRIAEGEPLPTDAPLTGHAIEARIYAEDPLRDYAPGTGRLHRLSFPEGEGIRVDAGYRAGSDVSPHYDALIAKVIASGPDRATASRRLARALAETWAPGVVTNLPLLRQIVAAPEWAQADLDTTFLARAGLPRPPPLNLDRGALAATVLGIVQRADLFPAPPAWRSYGRAEQRDVFRSGQETIPVTWLPTSEGWTIEVGRTRHVVRAPHLEGDVLALTVDSLRVRWRLCWVPASPTHHHLDDGDWVYVHLGDGEAFVQLEPRFPAPIEEIIPGRCTAATPGRVAAIHVAEGERVQAGARLVTLEAMKMEHAVTAPEEGVIRAIRVQVGQAVDAGAVLVDMDPEIPPS